MCGEASWAYAEPMEPELLVALVDEVSEPAKKRGRPKKVAS
jgi:hypothetical protein